MKTLIFFKMCLLSGVLLLSSCGKDDDTVIENTLESMTEFEDFVDLSDFLPLNTQSFRSVVFHPASKNLYIYAIGGAASTTTGYRIFELNTQTKQVTTVFEHNNASWNSGNGSEAMRMRFIGNFLYVIGGANNNRIHKLANVGTGIVSLSQDIQLPENSSVSGWGEPYDLASDGNDFYVLTMRNTVNIFSNTWVYKNNFSTPGTQSHGSSIIFAPQQGNLVVGRPNDGYLAMFRTNGIFVRAAIANTGTNISVPTHITITGQSYIYSIMQGKIVRLSDDLLDKKEFTASGAEDYSQFAVDESSETGYHWFYMLQGKKIKAMKILSEL